MPKYEYLRVPNFLIPADDVALGSIFYDLKDPTSVLNPHNIDFIPESDIKVISSDNFNETNSRSIKSHVSLKAGVLQTIFGVGGDLIHSFSKGTSEVYHCDQLNTKYFNPNQAYIDKSMEAQDVREYIEVNAWKNKKVYMITGLMTATGFTVRAAKSGEQGCTIEIGVDMTPSGLPVNLGAGGEVSQSHSRTVAQDARSEILFAYRVTRIKPRGDGTAGFKKEVAGALYHDDDTAEQNAQVNEWDTVSLKEEELVVEIQDK